MPLKLRGKGVLVERVSPPKFKRVQIGVFEFEANTNRSAGDLRKVGIAIPLDDPLSRVAKVLVAVFKRESRDGLTVLVLKFHPQASSRGSGEVKLELRAVEY